MASELPGECTGVPPVEFPAREYRSVALWTVEDGLLAPGLASRRTPSGLGTGPESVKLTPRLLMLGCGGCSPSSGETILVRP
jgi:hypothetical protein